MTTQRHVQWLQRAAEHTWQDWIRQIGEKLLVTDATAIFPTMTRAGDPSELHATSWNTAASTGAIGYMTYSEVKQYTRIYDLQQNFLNLQSRAVDSATGLCATTELLGSGGNRITSVQFNDAEKFIWSAVATVGGLLDTGHALEKGYTELVHHGGGNFTANFTDSTNGKVTTGLSAPGTSAMKADGGIRSVDHGVRGSLSAFCLLNCVRETKMCPSMNG